MVAFVKCMVFWRKWTLADVRGATFRGRPMYEWMDDVKSVLGDRGIVKK